MLPFIKELPVGALDLKLSAIRRDFTRVEGIAAGLGLGEHDAEISIDRCAGDRVSPEALKLRMMPIADGFAAQGSPRQEGFPPESDQAFRVKILGVEGPDSHVTE